jgi:hypothetical protein
VTLQLTVPVVGTVNGVTTTAGSFIMPNGTPVETWLAEAAQSGEYYNADKTLKTVAALIQVQSVDLLG